MKKLTLLTLMFLLCLVVNAQVDTVFVKDTYSFAIRGSETLYMDKYSPVIAPKEPTPCILFVFGGAFARGARDVPKYTPYFNFLVNHGYTVISIDYRLGLKEASQQKGLSEEQFAKAFINAVDMAVEDLFDATGYILEQADAWNIDQNNIITNGSSAGAVTVLQAEHAIINGTHNVTTKLPSGFNYAGVISFAGAIFISQGKVTWNSSPCPMMLLHGDADLQVPYNELVFGEMGLFGAKAISETLDNNDYPYYFYKFEDYGHEIASDPMQQNKEDVLWFLNTFIKEQKQYKVEKEQREIGRKQVTNKNFGFQDFVKGNFDR